MPNKFEDLSTYLAIVDAGGINAAAGRLGIAKSAVSRRLSDLERRLGASLVDRSSRRFETTVLGMEYARRARSLLTALDELDASVGPTESAAVVTILADRAIIAHWLVPAISRLDGATRALSLRLIDAASSSGERDADIHVATGGAKRGARLLFTTAMTLCASPEYLRQHASGEDDGDPRGYRIIGVEGTSSSSGLTMPDHDSAAAAAIAGLGVARLPDYVVAAAIDAGILISVPDSSRSEPVQISAWCSDNASTAAMRLLDSLTTATD